MCIRDRNDPRLAAMFGGHALFTISDKTFDRIDVYKRQGYHCSVQDL